MAAAIEEQVDGGPRAELIPGGRGDFIVIADGNKVWDKRRMGDDFPEEGFVVERLRELAAS